MDGEACKVIQPIPLIPEYSPIMLQENFSAMVKSPATKPNKAPTPGSAFQKYQSNIQLNPSPILQCAIPDVKQKEDEVTFGGTVEKVMNLYYY
jgi:hypothetical protein